MARAVYFGDVRDPAGWSPTVEVVAIAKPDLSPAQALDGLGGYDTYGGLRAGRTSRASDGLLPIGVAEGCRATRDVAKDAGAHLRRRDAARGPPRRPAPRGAGDLTDTWPAPWA